MASLALLLLYGLDIVAAMNRDQGFLPLDTRTRGSILGIPGALLPVIAYFMTRNESSKNLGIMIFVCGVLIVVGSNTILEMQSTTSSNYMSKALSVGPVIVLGVFVIMLGLNKIVNSTTQLVSMRNQSSDEIH